MGFQDTTTLVTIMMVATIAMTILFLATVTYKITTIEPAVAVKLRKTGKEPELLTYSKMKYHAFLSHTWRTGQDQVAVIKKQLMRLLPGVRCFLDVDDLRHLSALEEMISVTQCMVFFLSKGYFISPNCIREVKASADTLRPLCLLQESDLGKGGEQLSQLYFECPQEYQKYVFENADGTNREIIPWLRLTAYQIVSMRLLVERVLLASPAYEKDISLPLLVYGDITRHGVVFSRKMTLYLSPNNPGVHELLEEFTALIPGVDGSSVQPALVKQAIAMRARQESAGRRTTRPRCSRKMSDSGFLSTLLHSTSTASIRKKRKAASTESIGSNSDAAEVSCAVSDHGLEQAAGNDGSLAGSPRSMPHHHLNLHGCVDSEGSEVLPIISETSAKTRFSEAVEHVARAQSEGDTSGSFQTGTSTKLAIRVDHEILSAPTEGQSASAMLLYLNDKTFSNAMGHHLAIEVQGAIDASMPVYMVHENDPGRGGCPFDRHLNATPASLVRQGLYNKIAVAVFQNPEHREVGFLLLAEQLGGIKSEKKRKVVGAQPRRQSIGVQRKSVFHDFLKRKSTSR